MSRTIRGQSRMALKNAHLVGDIEYPLSVTFRQNAYNDCRGEVEKCLGK